MILPLVFQIASSHQREYQLGIHEELLENITRKALRCKFGFLRELISNSHDAYRRLISETSDPHAAVGKDIVIDIYKDGDNTNDGDVKESRENNGEDKGKDGNNEDGRRVFFSLEDKGIGMSIEELVNYVGKLGGSGTRDFNSDETIGQFGTGLYASLSVADELEILTKRYGSDKAYLLRLKRGSTAYTIDEIEKADVGTKVVLRIDDANKDEINRKNVCSWIETNMLNEKFEGYKLRIVRDKNNEIKKDDEENDENKKEDGEKKDTDEKDEGKDQEKDRKVKSVDAEKNDDPFEDVKMCEWPKNESEYERAYKSLKGSGNLISTLNFNFTVKQKTSQGYFDQVEYSAVVFIPEFFDLRLFGVENKGKHLLFVGGSLINDEHFAKPPYFLEPMYILLKSRNAHISSTREELLNSRESVNFIYESLQRRLVDHVKDILSSEKRDTFVRIYESYVKSGYLGAIRENNSKLKDSFAQILTFTTTSGVEKSETESKKNKTLAEIAGKDIYFTNSVDFKSGAPNPIFDGIEGDIILINGLADEQVLNAIGEFQGRKITDVQKLEFGSKKIDSENDPSGFLKDCKAKLKDIIGDVVISSRLKKSPFFLRTDKGQISSTMKKIMGTTGQSAIFDLMMNKKPVLEVNVESEEYKKIEQAKDFEMVKAFVVANSIIEDIEINQEVAYLTVVNLLRRQMGLEEFVMPIEENKADDNSKDDDSKDEEKDDESKDDEKDNESKDEEKDDDSEDDEKDDERNDDEEQNMNENNENGVEEDKENEEVKENEQRRDEL